MAVATNDRLVDRPLAEVIQAGRAYLLAIYGVVDRWTDDSGYAEPAQWLSKLVESVRAELPDLEHLPQATRFAFQEDVETTPFAGDV
jgi:hypothetical protein